MPPPVDLSRVQLTGLVVRKRRSLMGLAAMVAKRLALGLVFAVCALVLLAVSDNAAAPQAPSVGVTV